MKIDNSLELSVLYSALKNYHQNLMDYQKKNQDDNFCLEKEIEMSKSLLLRIKNDENCPKSVRDLF